MLRTSIARGLHKGSLSVPHEFTRVRWPRPRVSLISSLLLQSSGLVSVTDSEEPEESGGMRPALRPDEVDADDVIAGNP